MLLLAGIVVAVCSWILIVAAIHPIGPARFVTFIRRQRLTIWHEEALGLAPVRRYLATTQRWRVAGLCLAICFSAAAGLRQGKIVIDLLAIFMGWFVGAIVAEWRLGIKPGTALRRASLVRRRIGSYISAPRLFLPWLVTAAVMAASGYSVLFGSGMRAEILILLAMAVLPAAAAFVAGQHAVVRPAVFVGVTWQTVDFALRSRSLHALSGAVMGNGTVVLAGLIYLVPVLNPHRSWLAPLAVLAIGLAAAWWIAARPVPHRIARNPAVAT